MGEEKKRRRRRYGGLVESSNAAVPCTELHPGDACSALCLGTLLMVSSLDMEVASRQREDRLQSHVADGKLSERRTIRRQGEDGEGHGRRGGGGNNSVHLLPICEESIAHTVQHSLVLWQSAVSKHCRMMLPAVQHGFSSAICWCLPDSKWVHRSCSICATAPLLSPIAPSRGRWHFPQSNGLV